MARGLLVLLLVASVAACELVGGIDDRRLIDADAGPGSGGRGGNGGSKSLCQDYCSTVTRACTGEYAVYGNEDHCLSVCALMDQGKVGDGVGNTVACRLNAARDISTEPTDCRFAGPGGGGVCGNNCDSYCDLMSHGCSATEYRDFWPKDLEQCKSKCRALPDLDEDGELDANESRYSALNNDARDHDGDTVQCRLFHATVANTSVAGPPGHCWHASLQPRPGANGAHNPCSAPQGKTAPRCEDYCRLNLKSCTGDATAYESDAQCRAVCRTLLPGSVKDDGSGALGANNTLGCRNNHTYNALLASTPEINSMHCGHSGPGGAGVCGDDCVSYCDQLEDGCPAQLAGMGGAAKCQTDCRALLGEGNKVQYSVKLAKSNTSPLACRMLAVARALTDTKMAATACEVAVGRGECK